MKRSRKNIPQYKGRRLLTMGILLTGALILVARAVDLQVLDREFLQHEGDARHLREIPIPAFRGMITDRNGEPLAVSTPVDSAWANPPVLLEQGTEQLARVAQALHLDMAQLQADLAERAEREFWYVKRRVTPEEATALRAIQTPGIYLQREYQRFYPAGEVTAHLIGFTNVDDRGQEGQELAFETWLAGEPGARRVIKDRLGRAVEHVERVRDPRPGQTVALSIDLRLQYAAYRALKAAVLRNQAQGGTAVVMDVVTGEVLALVNQPSYNPNRLPRRQDESFRNRALTDVFEPGSVFKPFALIAAFESGEFSPNTLVDTNPGTLTIGGYTIRDFRNYGLIDAATVLTESSNVGIGKIAMELPAEHVWDVYQRFGFGAVTGTGFPGEAAGVLPHYRNWRTVDHVSLSRGYGVSVTTMQLLRAFAAIGNAGRIRSPSFLKDYSHAPQAVIDPSLAERLKHLMERVVTEGTGSLAAVDNYLVAGKTGTARKAASGGYSEDGYLAAFAGFAPASRPRLVAVVTIDDPRGDAYYGGVVAAPVFSEIMSAALRLLNVAPDAMAPDGPMTAKREADAEEGPA